METRPVVNPLAFPLAFAVWLLLCKHLDKNLQWFYWCMIAAVVESAFLVSDAVPDRARPRRVCGQPSA